LSARRSTLGAVNFTPRRVFAGGAAIVGLGALALPALHTYPTVLSLVIAFCAWGVVGYLKSGPFADAHFSFVWTAAVLLHVISFSIPAAALWIGLRNRKPHLCSLLLGIWCAGYLMLLFVLFPASAGL
jgi:hypothetical protein